MQITGMLCHTNSDNLQGLLCVRVGDEVPLRLHTVLHALYPDGRWHNAYSCRQARERLAWLALDLTEPRMLVADFRGQGYPRFGADVNRLLRHLNNAGSCPPQTGVILFSGRGGLQQCLCKIVIAKAQLIPTNLSKGISSNMGQDIKDAASIVQHESLAAHEDLIAEAQETGATSLRHMLESTTQYFTQQRAKAQSLPRRHGTRAELAMTLGVRTPLVWCLRMITCY